jgi:hypothetical protein
MIEIERKPHKTVEFYYGVYKADRDYKFAITKSINGKVEYKVVELDGIPSDDFRNDDGFDEDGTVIAVKKHIIATIEKRAPEYFNQTKEEE